MAAYLIVRVRVSDPDQYDEYKKLTPAAVAAHGGKFVVRGGAHEVLEGPAEDRRMVVLEFHPLAWSFGSDGRLHDPYFRAAPIQEANGVNDYVGAALAPSGFT